MVGDSMSDGASAPLPSSLSLHIPPTLPSLVCIEYPGYVVDRERALATLGGAAHLAEVLQESPGTLPLRFRPEDPHCHALVGTRLRARRLLVRLTRGRATEGDAVSGADRQSVQGVVVGLVDRAYAFDTPADMQYVSCDSRGAEGWWAARRPQGAPNPEPPGLDAEPLLTVPPVFLRGSAINYAALAARAGGRKGTAPGRQTDAVHGNEALPLTIEFGDPTPQPAGTAMQEAPGNAPTLPEALVARKVWTDAALQLQIQAEPALAAQLPQLCYKFGSGPWAHAWVLRGYDPRTNCEAAEWQTVAAPSTAGTSSQGPSCLALCDVADTDAALRGILDDRSNLAATVSERSGWLTLEAWAAAQARISALEDSPAPQGVAGAADGAEAMDVAPEPAGTAVVGEDAVRAGADTARLPAADEIMEVLEGMPDAGAVAGYDLLPGAESDDEDEESARVASP